MAGIGDTNRVATIFDHIVTEGLVYPSLAAGAAVQTAALNWVLGNYAVVVPAATILSRFHIHSITIESTTWGDTAIYQVELYHGAADVLVSQVRFSIVSGFFGNAVYPIASTLIPGGDQVRARAASSDGLAHQATLGVSICYCIEV